MSLNRWIALDMAFGVAVLVTCLICKGSDWPAWLKMLALALLIGPSIAIGLALRRKLQADPSITPMQKIWKQAPHLVSMILFLACAFVLLGHIQMLPMTIYLPIMMVGSMLLSASRKHRTGDRRHCPECEYPCDDPPGSEPMRCPECGHPWLGMWMKGSLRHNPRLQVAGYAFMLLAVATLIGGMRLNSKTSWVPTTALLWTAQRDLTNRRVWEDLSTRTISEQDRLRIAHLLVEAIKPPTEHLPAAEWLVTHLVTGSLPPELTRQALDRWVTLRADAITSRTVDELEIRLRALAPVLTRAMTGQVLIDQVHCGEEALPILAHPDHLLASPDYGRTFELSMPATMDRSRTLRVGLPRSPATSVTIVYWRLISRPSAPIMTHDNIETLRGDPNVLLLDKQEITIPLAPG